MLLPAQIVVADAVVVTVGLELTVIVIVAVFEHPGPFEPVTVYVVVDAGVTTTDVPLSEPGIQVYDVVPLPVSVVLPPGQIEVLDAVAVTVGCEPTVIVIVFVPVHPFAAVPFTVYVVVEAGVTTTGDPESDPGFQL